MDYQKKPPESVLSIFKKKNVEFYGISYFAYPATFPSTAGPRGGVGGCAMSTFTVEAYVCDNNGPTIYTCCGMFYFEDEPFKSGRVNTNRHWINL